LDKIGDLNPLDKIGDLKSTKKIWDRLHILYGSSNCNNDEEIEKSRKKKKEDPLEPVVKKDNKFKGHNDILLSYILDSSHDNDSYLFRDRGDDKNHMLLKAQYESAMVVIE